MRGNHRVWGRVYGPEPDVTTPEDRQRIASCELRTVENRVTHREVWKDGMRLGVVRVRAGGQDCKPDGCRNWRFVAYKWGDNDPHWGLAILALLDKKNRPCSEGRRNEIRSGKSRPELD